MSQEPIDISYGWGHLSLSLAVQCNLIGNPLHEEQLEIVLTNGRRKCS